MYIILEVMIALIVLVLLILVMRVSTFIKCAICGRRYVLLVPWFVSPTSRGWLQWGSDCVCPDCIEEYYRRNPHVKEAIEKHHMRK